MAAKKPADPTPDPTPEAKPEFKPKSTSDAGVELYSIGDRRFKAWPDDNGDGKFNLAELDDDYRIITGQKTGPIPASGIARHLTPAGVQATLAEATGK